MRDDNDSKHIKKEAVYTILLLKGKINIREIKFIIFWMFCINIRRIERNFWLSSENCIKSKKE